jgi:HSP20 family molecular chaperone IbpA
MSRLTMFNSPLLLGFDHVERMLDRISKNSAEGYPPYNIEQTSEDGLRITLAVAGFSEKNLTIEVEDRQLRIHGKQLDEADRMYLHRGIASRQFIRSFVLADGIDVMGAELDNGLLHIDLMRPPVESRVQTIEIKSDNPTGRKPRTVEVESD